MSLANKYPLAEAEALSSRYQKLTQLTKKCQSPMVGLPYKDKQTKEMRNQNG
jgi:hypothetical protein